jgi:putative glutamine amidotransferase
MTPIYVVQQSNSMKYDEQHDSLDVRWSEFLFRSGFVPILLPNNMVIVQTILASNMAKCALFTGGSLHLQKPPDVRSQVECAVMQWSLLNDYSLIGCCRGMQAMLQYKGGKLFPCSNQIHEQQTITFRGKALEVNSYHQYVCEVPIDDFDVIGTSSEQLVKAILGKQIKWLGIMWHPERMQFFQNHDINLFKQFLSKGAL